MLFEAELPAHGCVRKLHLKFNGTFTGVLDSAIDDLSRALWMTIPESTRELCSNIVDSCRHIHPKVVEKIVSYNRRDALSFARLFADRINLSHYLYMNSACVFPGVRRYIGSEKETMRKRHYHPSGRAILEDNEFPRHIWCFLEMGRPYNGPNWKASGLSRYELAHVFSHKRDEIWFERTFFSEFDETISPFGNYTSACNTVLVPKGMGPYTDKEPAIKAALFQRYIELYGEIGLCGRKDFNRSGVPEWYGELSWNEPVLPVGWEAQIEKLIAYRQESIVRALSKA